VTDGASCSADGLDEFKPSQINLNEFETKSNPMKIHSIKTRLSRGSKFEIKYSFEEFVERNNFPFRNISRFEMEFELKFREAFMS
jgi:hypothetical protein